MKNQARQNIIAVVAFIGAGPMARAGIIFDQPPTHVGGIAGDLDFYTDSGQRFWEQATDDFRLGGSAAISRVSWYGFYGGTFSGSVNPPLGLETIRVRVYSARASDALPGSVLREESFPNPTRMATGIDVIVGGHHPEYYYTADLATPFPADANTQYWLEIAQDDDVNSHFRWEYGQGNATPFAYINPSVADWTPYPANSGANFAFQLSTIPEPTTLFLSSCALIAAAIGIRRPRRRPTGATRTCLGHAKLLLTATAILAANAAPARAGVIFDQPPQHFGGYAGDLDFYTDSGDESWQQTADDFTLSSNAVISRLQWYGFYGGNFSGSVNPPIGPETMRVRLYSSRPSDGLPGSVLYEESFLNSPRTATGIDVVVGGHHPEYRYTTELSTPFEVTANISYWLEILQVDDVNSHFRWEGAGSTGAPFAFLNSNVADWTYSSPLNNNMAFQLSTVPEPATLFLSSCALIAAAIGNRRPRRRRN